MGISTDGGQQWRHPPMPTGQFYNIDVGNRQPYHVGGTMQDMGTITPKGLPERATIESIHVPGDAPDTVIGSAAQLSHG